MAYNFPITDSKISTQTASNSASLSFTSGITSNFTMYLVKVRKLVPATTNTSLLLTFSVDGGANYLSANYLWGNLTYTTGTRRTYNRSASDSSINLTSTISSTSTRDLNADIVLYDLSSSTYCAKCTCSSVCYNNGSNCQGVVGGGMNSGTTAVNAIKFAMSSGNITSGTITLYGINNGGLIY